MPPIETLLDNANDCTTAEKQTFTQCQADVEFITITNGGHTWPDGDQYLDASDVGLVSKDFSARELIIDFFATH